MRRLPLSRLVTVAIVVGGGMAAGHLLLPFAPPRRLATQAAFWVTVAALGAARGARDATLRGATPARRRRDTLLGAVASTLLALAGYLIVHGA